MTGRPAHLDLAAREARARAAHQGHPPARDAEARALLSKGFPNCVVLTDETPKKPAAEARKRLQAVDPAFSPRWAREVAVRHVNAFARETPLFGDEGVLAEALGHTEVPDQALLRRFFQAGLASTYGYPFAHADAVYVFEALLGADTVVTTWVDVLSAAPAAAWRAKNPNVRSLTHAAALGWVLLRASERVVAAALAGLAQARAAVGAVDGERATLARVVDFVLGDALPDLTSETERRLRVIHSSDAFAAARARHPWCLWICDPQDCWVTGTAPPARALARLPAEPRWLARHLAERWGLLAVPFSEELERMRHALPKKLTRKALDAEVRALFERLAADLGAARGDAPAEERVVREAACALVVLRARAGEPMPEVHVGHILAVDGWDRKAPAPLAQLDASAEELARWLAAIDAATA